MFDDLSIWIWGVVALDLAVAAVVVCGLRYGSGLLFGVNSRDELAEKDNLGFALALAGGAVAAALVLAAAGAGTPSVTLAEELAAVAAYAAVGLVLLKLGMLINDRAIFHRFSVRQAIQAGNAAAGTVQAANLVALGVLIHGAIGWSEGALAEALASVVVMFFLAQLVVLGVTRARAAIYARRHAGESWQRAIEEGNAALGVRYAGHLVGTALASSSAGGMVDYAVGADTAAVVAYAAWLAWAIVLAAVLLVLGMLAQRAVLHGVDVVDEVDRQRNVGVAAIEAAVFIGFGLVIRAVVG